MQFCIMEINFIPDLVQEVIPTICKYLAVQDIRSCRLVNKIWHFGATHPLKEKTVTNLNLNPTQKTQTILELTEKLRFQPLHINVLIQELIPIRECESRISQLIHDMGYLRSISITGCPRNNRKDWEAQLLQEMLYKSVNTLEKVVICAYFPFSPKRGAILKKVKRLAIHSLNWGHLAHISQTFLECCPHLEYLEMDFSGRSLWRKDPTHWPSSLTSLVFNTEYVQENYTSWNFAKKLLNFPNHLQVLYFHQIEIENEIVGDALGQGFSLYKLLVTHRMTLREFGVTLKTLQREICLPDLPEVTSLSITILNDTDIHVVCDTFNDSRKIMDLSKHLPKLKYLKLRSGPGVSVKSLLNSFLPDENTHLESYHDSSVYTIKVINIVEGLQDPDLQICIEQLSYLYDLFPSTEITFDGLVN